MIILSVYYLVGYAVLLLDARKMDTVITVGDLAVMAMVSAIWPLILLKLHWDDPVLFRKRDEEKERAHNELVEELRERAMDRVSATKKGTAEPGREG